MVDYRRRPVLEHKVLAIALMDTCIVLACFVASDFQAALLIQCLQ